MLKGFIPLLMPFKMAYHFLLLDKDTCAFPTVKTMEVFPVVELPALLKPALGRVWVPSHIPCIVHRSRSFTQQPFPYHREWCQPSAWWRFSYNNHDYPTLYIRQSYWASEEKSRELLLNETIRASQLLFYQAEKSYFFLVIISLRKLGLTSLQAPPVHKQAQGLIQRKTW